MWTFQLFDLLHVDIRLVVAFLVLLLTYIYLNWQPNTWKLQGIPGPPSYPFFGTSFETLKKGQRTTDQERYEKYGRVFGTVERQRLTLVVADEQMLRDIMVKNFSHFVNRKAFFMSDEVSENMLISLRDDAWRRVRNLLTPTFSTGKLKMMMTGVTECCQLLMRNLGDKCDRQEDIECKQLFGAFTMDIIARTGFGIEVNTQQDPDNEFARNGQRAFSPKYFVPLAISSLFFPWLLPLAKFLGVGLFDGEMRNFFAQLVEQITQGRTEKDSARKDLMQLMLNAHKDAVDAEDVAAEFREMGESYDATSQSKRGLSKKELIAQGFLLLSTGYETTATTISMLVYCMACHPQIQERLYSELVHEYGEEGEVDYLSMNKVDYLNMCIEETLRMYPPAGRFDRIASQETTVGGIQIPVGSAIIVPVIGIHYDEKIYPEPETFKPERFTAEAKAARSPFHYLPFGYGPRSCIGMRLALIEIKMAAIHIFRTFQFLPCEKTEIPLQFTNNFFLNAKNGTWVKMARRR